MLLKGHACRQAGVPPLTLFGRDDKGGGEREKINVIHNGFLGVIWGSIEAVFMALLIIGQVDIYSYFCYRLIILTGCDILKL